jgi:uncharacterized protein (UPF0276 family)
MVVADFLARLAALPVLGVGVSTEYGARRAKGALDPVALRREHPAWGGFLEVGVEIAKGLDDDARRWIATGAPTTHHFLDVNLDEPADFDEAWLEAVAATAKTLGAAWLCGDAGMWHFGDRDRGQMLLLPPVLEPESIAPMAEGIARLREANGREVLPENPPGPIFVGRMHILELFARLSDEADTGLLLDCAHLAMFQRARGHALFDATDVVPWDRVIELHVAGGSVRTVDGLDVVEDDHGPGVLDDTWALFEHACARATHLRAVVVECERNPIAAVAPIFERVHAQWSAR